MSAYPTPLTPDSIQSAMQLATGQVLGFWQVPTGYGQGGYGQSGYGGGAGVPSALYSAVRIEWQPLGQPFKSRSQDVTFLRCVEVDVPEVNRQRNSVVLPNPADVNNPPQSLLRVMSYTRVWETFWEVAGPNSFDNTRKIHSALFSQALHDVFATLGLNLYWVPDSAAPRRVPYVSDGQWWERTDFEARFNEGVIEPTVIPIAASVEVKAFESHAGQIADLVVDLQATGLGTSPLGYNPFGQ